MRPVYARVCVCAIRVCVDIVYISFPVNVKVSRSGEINISSFFDTEHQPQIDHEQNKTS